MSPFATPEGDILHIKNILPSHYTVSMSGTKRSFRCKSDIGFTINGNKEDTEMWEWFLRQVKAAFPERFQEVYHNTCFLHKDFNVYLRECK